MLIKPWLRGVLWRFPGGLNCIAGDVSYYCDLDTRDVYLIGYVSVCWGGPLRIVLVASKQAIPATTLAGIVRLRDFLDGVDGIRRRQTYWRVTSGVVRLRRKLECVTFTGGRWCRQRENSSLPKGDKGVFFGPVKRFFKSIATKQWFLDQKGLLLCRQFGIIR